MMRPTTEDDMAKQITWFDVGVSDAKAGKPYRPPEHYGSRMSYRQGYESVRSVLEG
jgi:hypothetical protein